MEIIIMVAAICACCIIMMPRTWRRKAFGYVNLTDFLAISFVVTHFMGAGAAASSLYIGVLAMLALTIVLRFGRALFGSERLSLNGDTSISAVVAGLFTQGTRWLRAIVGAVFNGGVVCKPEPLAWRWVE